MAFAIGTIYMKTLTKEELAKILDEMDARDYRIERNARIAADNNLVIAYGASDDLLELKGAINDEIGAYDGGQAYIKDGELVTPCDELCEQHCPDLKQIEDTADAVIKAYWDEGDCPWFIEANVPYAPFFIYEDGPFCRGIVIDLDEL